MLVCGMMSRMPKLRMVESHTHFDAQVFFYLDGEKPCAYINQVKADVKAGVRARLMTSDHNLPRLTFRQRLFAHSGLVSMSRTYQLTALDRQRWPLLTEGRDWDRVGYCLAGDSSNHILYEAKLSTDEASWWGLNLEVVEGRWEYQLEDYACAVEDYLETRGKNDSDDDL